MELQEIRPQYILEWERRVRRDLAEKLAYAPRDELLKSIQLAERKRVRNYAEELGLKLVPSPELVESQPIILPPADSEKAEPAWLIVVDILIGALNMGLNREIVLQAIEGDSALRQQLKSAANQVTTHDWKTLAETIDKILNLVLLGGFLERLQGIVVEAFGPDAARRILRRTIFQWIVRFVPFVGWAYMTLSLVVAAKQNVHRFQRP